MLDSGVDPREKHPGVGGWVKLWKESSNFEPLEPKWPHAATIVNHAG